MQGAPEPSRLNEAEVLRILNENNPWWRTDKVPPSRVSNFRRRDLFKLKESLQSEKIVALVGARQVGKTTLIYQLIEDLIPELDPKRILYLSLDDPYLRVTVDSLRSIFDLYAQHVIREPLSELIEPVFIFLDEIQSVQGWEKALKRWFDLKYKMKILVSGSSSVSILTGGAEALVGRLSPQIVLPMKYLETVRLNTQKDDFERKFNHFNWELRDAFKESVIRQNPQHFFEVVQNIANGLAADHERLELLLNDYFLKGGYPEVVMTNDLLRSARLLRDYLNLTLYKDIIKIFKIRDPSAIEDLITLISKETSSRLNYSELADALEIKRDTLRDYLYFLKTAFLISESEFYSRSRRKRLRKEKKLYMNDAGIRNIAAGVFSEAFRTDPTEVGRVAEGVVCDHLKRLKFNLDPAAENVVFYWSGTYEVDFILELMNRPIPIEVKYSDNIESKDLRAIEEFHEQFEGPFGLLVTKNRLDFRERVVFVPMWEFLLMC